MSNEYTDVVAVREDASAPGGETTVIRLLGLLPAHLSCSRSEVRPDRVLLRVGRPAGCGDAAARAAFRAAMADNALVGWTVQEGAPGRRR